MEDGITLAPNTTDSKISENTVLPMRMKYSKIISNQTM